MDQLQEIYSITGFVVLQVLQRGDRKMDKLLNVQELADLLGVVPRSIYGWATTGRLPAIRFGKRCIRFRQSDIERLLESLSKNQENFDDN